jgi:hypothetical protein
LLRRLHRRSGGEHRQGQAEERGADKRQAFHSLVSQSGSRSPAVRGFDGTRGRRTSQSGSGRFWVWSSARPEGRLRSCSSLLSLPLAGPAGQLRIDCHPQEGGGLFPGFAVKSSSESDAPNAGELRGGMERCL